MQRDRSICLPWWGVRSKKRRKSLPRAFNFSLLNFGSFFSYEYASIVQILVQRVLKAEVWSAMKGSQIKRYLITERTTNHRSLCDGQSTFWLFKMSFTTEEISLCTSPSDGAIRSGTTLWTTAKRCIRTLSFPTLCATSLVRKWRQT